MRSISAIATSILVSHAFQPEAKAQAPLRPQCDKPNVIIILTDDQGWGDLSIHGNTNLSTPHLDSLAQRGAMFNNFYVCPVSSPTRAEMLTGRYSPHCNIYGTSSGAERLDLDETTMPEIFKAAGYKTAAFGKWHNGMQYPYHPLARGFDEFYGFCSGHWGNYFSPMLEHNGQLVQGQGYLPNDLTNHAINFMEKNRNNPFFLYIPFNTPHSPMQVPDKWWHKHKDHPLKMRHRDPKKEFEPHTRAALAMCENIDWNVGRLLDKIDSLGLNKNTIIVFFSDNGPNGWRWNGKMKGKKGSLDEGGIRSPLFICWEGLINPKTTINAVAGAIDVLPTMCDLAAIDVHTNKPVEGKSLEPLLFGNNTDWEERLLFTYWRGKATVRNQNFRLDNQGNLFKINQDRGQKNNVANSYSEIKETLQDTLLQWKKIMDKEFVKQPRSFTLGHPNFKYTQLPARDAYTSGNIKRSNRFPNCTYFTNWKEISDKIIWNVDILSPGEYNVTLYYTCPAKDTGSVIELKYKKARLSAQIKQPHNPPLFTRQQDRVERMESHIKAFLPMNLGKIKLEKGQGKLTLRATSIPNNQVMDFRLLMFEKLE